MKFPATCLALLASSIYAGSNIKSYNIDPSSLASGRVWNQFPQSSTVFDDTAPIYKSDVSVINLGPMQSTSMPFYQFLLSSIMPLPRLIRNGFVYHRDRLLRPTKRQYAFIDKRAVEGRFDYLLRLLLAHRLCMLSVKVHKPPEFQTSLSVRLFAERWGPRMKGWQLAHYHQAGNMNGYVVYDHPKTDTLAIIFRPYIDNDVLKQHAKGFFADSVAYTTATPFQALHINRKTGELELETLKTNSKNTVYVHPAIYREYLAMEKDLLEFLLEYESRPADQRRSNLLVAGRSAAGVYAQFFSMRASLIDTPAIASFKRKHMYSFNAPPVVSIKSSHGQILEVIEGAGWHHSRVVSDDFCAVYWIGSPLTAEYVQDYHHLGPAIHVTDDRSIVKPAVHRATTILRRNGDNFPDRCFSHTSVPNIKELAAITKIEWWWFWKKARYHILGMHLMLEFMWNALRKRFKVNDERLYELAFINAG